MNFLHSIIAIFAGACLGFISSILFFLWHTRIIERKKRKTLIKHLIKELEFNIHSLEDLSKKLENVSPVSKYIEETFDEQHPLPKFIVYGNYFTENYFNQEYLFEKLTPEDIYKLNEISKTMKIYISNLEEIINEFELAGVENKMLDAKMEDLDSVWEREKGKIKEFTAEVRRIKKKLEE